MMKKNGDLWRMECFTFDQVLSLKNSLQSAEGGRGTTSNKTLYKENQTRQVGKMVPFPNIKERGQKIL